MYCKGFPRRSWLSTYVYVSKDVWLVLHLAFEKTALMVIFMLALLGEVNFGYDATHIMNLVKTLLYFPVHIIYAINTHSFPSNIIPRRHQITFSRIFIYANLIRCPIKIPYVTSIIPVVF